MARQLLTGSFVALITPFNRDGSVDFAAFRSLLTFHEDHGTSAVLIMGYYVGTLANTLPLPGGIGGVEGGMIGAFVGFGVDGSLAVLHGPRRLARYDRKGNEMRPRHGSGQRNGLPGRTKKTTLRAAAAGR